MIFVGVDWAEQHHDLHVMDPDGRTLGRARISEGIDGVARLHALAAEHVADPAEVVVGIETDRGLLVTSLVAAGDSDLAEAIKVTARAHQNLVWTRQRQANQLRSALREYYPGALAAFGSDLAHRDAIAVLAKAPTPELGRRLSTAQIASVLRHAGRVRNVDTRAAAIRDDLRGPHLTAPVVVADAYGASAKALISVIATLTDQIDTLESALTDRFEQHPDADILRSLPGLAIILGARVLGEFGDDPNRYADAKARKNYAGSSPITKQSGSRKTALARYVRNRRLADALTLWAFCSLQSSPGARAFYDRRRAVGDTHHKALRALSNRWVGILHGCLRHHTRYDEATAWSHRQQNLKTAA